MKRAISLLLCFCMILSFAACGKNTVQLQQLPTEPVQVQQLPTESAQAQQLPTEFVQQTVEVQPTEPAIVLPSPEEPNELGREEKELIAELIGGQDAGEMSDTDLDTLVEELVNNLELSVETDGEQVATAPTQGNNTPAQQPEQNQEESTQKPQQNEEQKVENPAIDNAEQQDAYNEEGEMTKPFDEVYPELIEEGKISFSGESILIKMKSGKLTEGLKAAGVGALEEIVPMGDVSWYEAKLIEGVDAQTALAAVRELDEVLLAEFNYNVVISALDDYKHFDKEKEESFKKNGHNKDQWHFHHCGIPDGYDKMEVEGGDSSIVVAVIDSGVDYDHEDLKDNMWVNAGEVPDNGVDDDGNGYVDDYYGVDIVAGYGNGDDSNGHGTHVAGIIAAKNNNIGVVGIAYNVKIMSVKAAMHNGTLNQADIARAVLYAYEMGAEVINMSFGGSACSLAVQDALATAYTRCVLVASAGNDGENNEPTMLDPIFLPNYPAALSYVLGVMSVDETGRESVFTNYDVKAFNGVEYELYAPGENIMSTLPNNKYGFLSGTSMAAPVVSAFAAILRSEYADRDRYPTKFIYGQLTSTSGLMADCLNPQIHGQHNLPQIANLYDALTKLPKPEVSMYDFAIFDSVAIDPEHNNGDGVIDAGETIHLGLTLRNRWGMSKNTQVTIDTISAASGMSDPYLTIVNSTVDYGSVGTYSTQTAGEIRENGMLVGWEKPFVIKVAENCPNDYRMTINVSITCENALDEEDTAAYKSYSKAEGTVRSGMLLPSIIEKDMVLTKNNLYIIPSATIIQEGVTVRVKPGTHIQFWTDDPSDPYAEDYIAYLMVKGKFLVEGTKEEPVYIYPSQLMDNYIVDIGEEGNGYISMKYADVTNLSLSNTSGAISYAYGCTFRKNYGGPMYARRMDNGKVVQNYYWNVEIGRIDHAEKCVFYKLGNAEGESGAEYHGVYFSGDMDTCIFVDCGLRVNSGSYESAFVARNCVFLGNAFTDYAQQDRYYNNSVVTVGYEEFPFGSDDVRLYYYPENGSTYLVLHAWGGTIPSAYIAWIRQLGGEYALFQTEEEVRWFANVAGDQGSTESGIAYYPYYLGITYDFEQEKYVCADGSEIPVFLQRKGITDRYSGKTLYLHPDLKLTNAYMHGLSYIYEIPGQVLPEDITFQAYQVAIDTGTTYQLVPRTVPVQLETDEFLYESTDESVVTVSESGLVTPVAEGTADVWVWSLDKAVRNRVTFHIREYVALEALDIPMDATELAVGEKLALECVLTPADTTRKNVTYTSSDESVVKVSSAGVLTGVGSGTATITATCEGISDTIEVSVFVKASSLQLDRVTMSAALTDGTMALPGVITSPGAETQLIWRSTDEEVAVIEEGALTLKAAGTTSLVVTDNRSGLSAACLMIVAETETGAIKSMVNYNDRHYVLLEEGSLYMWDNEYHTKPVLVATGVKACYPSYSWCAILFDDGTVARYHTYSDIFEYEKFTWFQGQNLVDVKYIEQGNGFYLVRNADGNVYAWGDDTYGQSGTGLTGNLAEPVLVNLDDVVDIKVTDYNSYFLTGSGELYTAGNSSKSTTPVLVDTNVIHMNSGVEDNCFYITAAGAVKSCYGNSTNNYGTVELTDLDMADFYSSDCGIVIRNGKPYVGAAYDMNSDKVCDMEEVTGITNAVQGYAYDRTYYIITEDGLLLGLGRNDPGYNAMAGITTENPVTTPAVIPLAPMPEEEIRISSNLQEGVLSEHVLNLTFNKALTSVAPKLYADGRQVTMKYAITDFNNLQITRTNGFAAEVTYELVFNTHNIQAAGGVTNEQEIRIAFTCSAAAAAAVDLGDEILPEEEPVVEPEGESVEEPAAEPEAEPNAEPEVEPAEEPAAEPAAESERDILVASEEPVVYEAIVDETIQRVPTKESLRAKLDAYLDETKLNVNFTNNAILSPVNIDTNVNHWLRVLANQSSNYTEILLGGNYWGTTNEALIGKQIMDYADMPTYARVMYAPFLTEAPENTFPFVTSVELINKYGDAITTVSNEKVTFRVKFNRDMDTSIPLRVRFGSDYPYGDYEVAGEYVNARTWEGVYTFTTVIENGAQYINIFNGCSATDDLDLQPDDGRFGFYIDTAAAQALIMQGTATDTGIELRWTQDDFDTLMGYNVYRSTDENGHYTRLNATVISADTMTFFDDTVEPGQVYYYNFTVVKTDMSESEPSGKIVIMSKDTMAPNIYHSPVTSAFTGKNLVLTATVTDNLNIAYTNLYYRVTGTDEWNTIRMNSLNDKYSAIIPASYVTVDGLEYYFQAFDGVSYTYKGSKDAPYSVFVQEAIDDDALGDVDSDGVITNRDALLVLYAINGKYNMTTEEFARADLNGDKKLWASEALQILRYVSGVVGSVKMS